MELFNQAIFRRVDENCVLSKIDALLDWKPFSSVLKRTRQRHGTLNYEPICLFRALLLSQWYSLSDRELERSLCVRLDFIKFCGFGLDTACPDHTTLCKFRNLLVELDLYDKLLELVNSQLEEKSLKVSNAEHAIIDATLVNSAARPGKIVSHIPQDRMEDESDEQDTVEIEYSKDTDARWVKKGNKSYFGYKCFARVDGEGYFDKCMARPANESETPHFEEMVEGAKLDKEKGRVLSDKGNASKANRLMLKRKGFKDGIMHKGSRAHPVSKWGKRFNRLISKKRYVIEQSFGTIKRKFGFSRASYMGVKKVQTQMIMKAICLNLLKAANKVMIIPKIAG